MESDPYLEPDPRSWAALAQRPRPDVLWKGKPLSEWRQLTRRELGIPDDRTIIATGHQAGFWHPGILAKFLAADALVESIGREAGGAIALHLVVDHVSIGDSPGRDDHDCVTIAVPMVDSQGVLAALALPILKLPSGSWIMHTPYGSHLEQPTGELPALDPVDAAGLLLSDEVAVNVRAPALESIPDSLRRIEIALRHHRDASSLAQQMAEAVHDELARWMPRPELLFASRLMGTSFGRAIVNEMASDPGACAQHYNKAVASGEGEGAVRPLELRNRDWEMPVWRLDADGRRRPAYATELASIDPSSFRPRALLMTAIMRLVVCDLFIHGRGGFEYDRAMERWIREWLGLPVCPMTMASADVFLFPPDEKPAFEFGIDEAQHALRHVFHDPASSDPDVMSQEKATLLGAINAAPRGSREKREKFLEYHRWLETARHGHSGRLAETRDALARLRLLAANQRVIGRRDWAFPLYPRETLDALNSAIRNNINKAPGPETFTGSASRSRSIRGE